MNVLFYREPRRITGGASNVAYYLPRALEKKVNLTCFPGGIGYDFAFKLIRVYKEFLERKFNIIQFNIHPSIIQYSLTSRWIDGNYLLLKYAKSRAQFSILNVHGITCLESNPSHTNGSVLQTMDALKACKKVDKIIVNSEYMRSKVITLFGISREKIAVIPNGIDLKKFSVRDKRTALDGNPAILFVGHLWWIKGVDVLLRAMMRLKSALPEAKLHIVGDRHEHEHEKDYRRLAKRLSLEEEVIFHGAVPYSKIPYYFKSATLCVIPSLHEGFSLTMLEAMASGTPIVASDIERFREILQDGENALLFKSGDAVSLSAAILKLSTDSSLRKKITQSASKTVLNYSWDSIAERYVSLYKSLCE